MENESDSYFELHRSFNVVLFEQAMKDAALLDAEFAATKRVKGPLHGVPMTFKDCCMYFAFVFYRTF